MAKQHSIPQRDVDRFWAHVDKTDTCWLWTASFASHGYGQIMVGGRMQRAHRVSWMVTHGEIPPGLRVLHRCDNPPCCNPDHLFLGTQRENVADMLNKGREARGERCGAAKLTSGQVAEIKVLLATHAMSPRSIAAKFGVSRGAIDHISYGSTWVHIAAPLVVASDHKPDWQIVSVPRGEGHHRAKLTEHLVREARRRHAGGESVASLSCLFDVSKETIREAVTRKSWKHVA